jgi:hypothetical protein
MSFRENLSGVALANRALSRLAQTPINSIDPATPSGVGARAVDCWYKPTVARLLEVHHWNLARKRLPLTETTNDRVDWLYKYAVPPEVAFPVSLSTLNGTGGLQYYAGLGGLLGSLGGRPAFLLAGRFLYSRYAGDLDFVSYDITEADFNSTFANIVDLTLAANMAYAITKNRARETELRTQASSAINIAIAANLNAGNPRYGDEISERDRVRGDFGQSQYNYGNNWDWWPGPAA